MDTKTSKPHESVRSEPDSIDPLIAFLIPKPKMTALEKLEHNSNETDDRDCCLNSDHICCSIIARWWNVRYKCQREIIHFVEQALFHIAIIVLVLIDCLLVIAELLLDFIKLNKPCDTKTISNSTKHNKHGEHGQVELITEILHYASLILLAVFLIEVLIKAYAFGRHWWDFHTKKMEWLDAIIVIVSFAIDLVTLYQTNLFAEIALLFISLRLWRFIRIINCVAQTIRSQGESRKKHFATTYHAVTETFLAILEKKTVVLLESGRDVTPENFDKVLEKFRAIDQSCRTILEHYPHPAPLSAVTDISHRLKDIINSKSIVQQGVDD